MSYFGLLIIALAIEYSIIIIEKVLYRIIVSLAVFVLLVLTAVVELWHGLNLFTILLAVATIYQLINLYKFNFSEKPNKYLINTFVRSWYIIAVIEVFAFGAATLISLSGYISFVTLIVVQSTVLLVLYFSLIRNFLKLNPKIKNKIHLSDLELPTVTVAIPARNEDEQLIICLDSLISSDYPKLEILVLDDCSQSKRTSQIIRSYAQSGVTFIQGEAPKSNYLAKNFAYQELLEVANGQFILYAGVDVRFRSDSIRKIVEFILINKKNMISILPNTILPSRARLRVVLIQSLRYLWELGLPRRQFNKPPVLSTCWMINRQLLIHQGGFKGLRREIIPERTLASRISRIKDGYVFMKSGQYFGINSYKDFLAQYQTAIRVKYPSLKQRLELVMLVSIIEIVLFGGIIFDLLAAIFVPSWILLVWSIVIFGLINIVYFSLLKFLFNKYYYSALIYGSILLLVDVVLWNISMIKYEFSEVIWKNRNVCIPTMRLD